MRDNKLPYSRDGAVFGEYFAAETKEVKA